MQQHAPASNSFVEVNRTGERKSSEILFANTHQTVDSPRVTKKDTLWQKPSLSMCLKRISLSNTYFCFVTTVKQRRHSPSKWISEKNFCCKVWDIEAGFSKLLSLFRSQLFWSNYVSLGFQVTKMQIKLILNQDLVKYEKLEDVKNISNMK